MINILLSGCNGRMGRVITDLVRDMDDLRIAAGVDLFGSGSGEYPVYRSFKDCKETADVIVDFSSAKAFEDLADYAAENRLPLVLCTTGLSDEQLKKVQELTELIPVLRSANMSLGVNLLIKLVKEAAAALAGKGYDIEIVERHHNQKMDAPSGTALMLADSANDGLGGGYNYVYDRQSRFAKRDEKEIGISAVRGGTIPGTHEVIFAGTDEVIELNHIAYSRSIFGKGAVSAALYLVGKEPGLYSMADVMEL